MLLPSSVATIPDVVGACPLSPHNLKQTVSILEIIQYQVHQKADDSLICFLETVRMEWDGMERKDGDAGPFEVSSV